MTTLTNLVSFVKESAQTYNTVQSVSDKEFANNLLTVTAGNKVGATTIAVVTIGAGIAMNYGLAKYLDKKGHKKSATFMRGLTNVGLAMSLPSYKRIIKNIVTK